MPLTDSTASPLDACNPSLNATVSASAGSGKTWLLITRIVRLLIDGAEPGNIIALTFTRKAAGEMQVRLNQRLFELATAEEKELEESLQLIGCEVNQNNKDIARNLYERLINSLYPIRIQTFHSFCQDILSRFPLEADIPPGFELIEDSSLLERQAWRMLFDEASLVSRTRKKTASSRLNDELDIIMQACNGPDNTHTALQNFLAHRSDWWAYTNQQKHPVKFASQQLAQQLQIDDNDTTDPVDEFLNDITRQNLLIFANLLREIKLKTSLQHAELIDAALDQKVDDAESAFSKIREAFLTKKGEPLSSGRKYSNTLEKKLGTENAQRFVELHQSISADILAVDEIRKRRFTYTMNKAWYYVGQRYLDIFQQLKSELRLLDFTDLEWKCFQLLQQSDNAHWVQYKIDQRIDHLLIDEFQDTNPTQWHLLSPILEEIAANPEERSRSVFLVGDEKQSIYSFRRANPALQAQASEWLADNLAARATPLDFSRRSSPAIIHCVNLIFEQETVKNIMTGFTHHDTHLNRLPGKVFLCDLFEKDCVDDTGADGKGVDDSDHEDISFRNPLKQPREVTLTTPRHDEADYIARQIAKIINSAEPITDSGVVRAARFGDILILVRNRTHLNIYEDALKRYGIPFIGNKKGGLLDNLEIKDLNCLLNTLITPFDNLSFAQVLKSPIFAASDDDLIRLARLDNISSHWYERLMILTGQLEENSDAASAGETKLSEPLRRAANLLPRWQILAEKLPVHDCLDKIFSEGEIIQRYLSANRPENRQRIATNCQRFLELSLEVDSGRYPSITRFLQRLSHLEQHSQNPPEEPLSPQDESRVRLMTIHGSKGLEAPVVFLADCNSTARNNNAYAGLINWPAEASCPTNFQLQLSKDKTDKITEKLQQKKQKEQEREELNLLYVALTRAREQLYISGIESHKKQNNSWYQIISDGLGELETSNIHNPATDEIPKNFKGRSHEYLGYDNDTITADDTRKLIEDSDDINVTSVASLYDERLLNPMAEVSRRERIIAPSHDIEIVNEKDPAVADNLVSTTPTSIEPAPTEDFHTNLATWRGTIIHRVLEQLCIKHQYPAEQQSIQKFLQQLRSETMSREPVFDIHLDACIEEAIDTYNTPELSFIFDPPDGSGCYNEMPLIYTEHEQTVYGILDRVIKSDEQVMIIDYKSHRFDAALSPEDGAQKFARQIAYYRAGAERMWPQHTIRAGVLLTHHKQVIWL